MAENTLYVLFACGGSVILGAGVCGLIYSSRLIWRGIRARSWPQAEGRVLSVRRVRHPDSEGDQWEVLVRYEYEVNGTAYQGGTIHPTYVRSGAEAVHVALESVLKAGQRVRIHYHPGHPDRSMLSAGLYTFPLWSVFLFCGMIAMGCGFLAASWPVQKAIYACFLSMLAAPFPAFWFGCKGTDNFADGIAVVDLPASSRRAEGSSLG